MKNHITTSVLLALLMIALTPSVSFAQRDRGPNPEKLRERISDLRKVKLLDVLDLQGEQVEKFFAVYNSFENKIESAKEAVDRSSRDLQKAIGNDASDAELQRLTKDLRDKIKGIEQLIEDRFDESRKVLTTQQYAQYVVFEARFREELQQMILDRMKRMRDR